MSKSEFCKIMKTSFLHLFVRLSSVATNYLEIAFFATQIRIKRENAALSCSVFRCCIFWQHNLELMAGFEPATY